MSKNFEICCFKMFTISVQNPVEIYKTMLTAFLWLTSTKLKFDLRGWRAMGRVLMVTAVTNLLNNDGTYDNKIKTEESLHVNLNKHSPLWSNIGSALNFVWCYIFKVQKLVDNFL